MDTVMERTKYLDPTNDIAFKKVFMNAERLKDFLNGVLTCVPEGLQITELQFLSQEALPNTGSGKRGAFDLKCKDQAGNYFIIEMQNRLPLGFLKRVQFYTAYGLTSQLGTGNVHKGLMPVIAVVITKKNLFPKKVHYVNYHDTREVKTREKFLNEMSYLFVELGKFKKPANELKTIEDYWLYFLANTQETTEPPKSISDKLVLEAYDTILQFNWSEPEYDAYLRARLLAEGEEENLEESENKGFEKGKAKGKAERDIEIAKNLLAAKADIKVISQATGLSEAEIKKLTKDCSFEGP